MSHGPCKNCDESRCHAADCHVAVAAGKVICARCEGIFDVEFRAGIARSIGRTPTDAEVDKWMERAWQRRPN